MKRSNYLYSVNIVLLLLLCLGLINKDMKAITINNVSDAKNGNKEEIKYKPGVYTTDDLQVIDRKTNKVISLGMTKEEVTNLLGKEDRTDFRNINDYNGLRVFFRDDVVAGLMVQAGDNIDSRYITRRDVGLGTEIKIVLDRYGDAEIEDAYGSSAITYRGKLDGKNLITNTGNDTQWTMGEQDKIYVISFSFFNNNNKTLSGIYISDFTFAYTGK